MKYIDEINSFQDWLLSNSHLSSSARILWYTLMHYNNKCGWKEEFNIAMSALELSSGMSKQAITRARNVLRQAGRIEFTTRPGNQSTVYRIIPFAFQNGTQSDTQGDTQTDTQAVTQADTLSDTQSGTQADTIPRLDKTRLDKTKGKESKPKKSASRAKPFVKPTREEVRAYCIERDNNVDPDKFYDYYEATGWMIGKKKMKDWKAAIRTWERNSKEWDRQKEEMKKEAPKKSHAVALTERMLEKYGGVEIDVDY